MVRSIILVYFKDEYVGVLKPYTSDNIYFDLILCSKSDKFPFTSVLIVAGMAKRIIGANIMTSVLQYVSKSRKNQRRS